MDTQKQLNVPLQSVAGARRRRAVAEEELLRGPDARRRGAREARPTQRCGSARTQAPLEWYIKLFLGVHFAANWVSVH